MTGPINADLGHYLHTLATSGPSTTVASPSTPKGVPSGSTTSPAHPAHDDGPPIAPVPEPSGVALAVTGLGALALIARCRRARRV